MEHVFGTFEAREYSPGESLAAAPDLTQKVSAAAGDVAELLGTHRASVFVERVAAVDEGGPPLVAAYGRLDRPP